MSENTRNSVAAKIYIDGDGNESRHAGPETVGMQFRFVNGGRYDVNVTTMPETIRTTLAWHGVAQKLGDAYSGKSGEDAEEAFASMLERLVNGEWVKRGESAGPRTSMLVDAIVALREKSGNPVDPAAVAAKLKDADQRKAAMLNPSIAAEYERMRAERAAAKAKAAAAAAAAAKASGGSDGGFNLDAI